MREELSRYAVDSLEVVTRASKDLSLLRELVQKRKEYCEKTGEELTNWLLNGTLILDTYGWISLYNPSNDGYTHSEVEDMSDKCYNGYRFSGGDQAKLPRGTCVCCGKEITLEDVYNHNFHVRGWDSFHSGECRDFYYNLTYFLGVSKDIIQMCNRVFGKLQNVCINQKDIAEGVLAKISFSSLGYDFEIIVLKGGNGISISYLKDGEKNVILNSPHYCGVCLPGIEEELKKIKIS